MGTLELDYEGIPSPEISSAPSTLPDESLEGTENVGEFDEEENKHYHETAEEFEIRCDFVTVGVGDEEEGNELVEESEPERGNSVRNSGGWIGNHKSQSVVGVSSLVVVEGEKGRFRKNPMHRAPPSMGVLETTNKRNRDA